MSLGRALRAVSLALIVVLLLPITVGAQVVGEGVSHESISRLTAAGEPVLINYLSVDLTNPLVEIKPVLADDAFRRLETLSSMAQRYGAVGGINGTMFVMNKNLPIPVDTLVHEGEILSEASRTATSLIITSDKGMYFDKLQPRITLHFGITGDDMEVNSVNHTLGSGVNLYTPAYGTSTGNPPTALEAVVEKDPAGNYRITQICEGNASIPENGFVISMQGNAVYCTGENFHEGTPVTMSNDLPADIREVWANGPLLVKDGAVVNPIDTEGLSDTLRLRHPRSALGITDDNRLLMVAVDGRQPEVSVGLTYEEMAQLMVELGAREAMCLDGGGSTELWAGKSIVNSLIDGKERPIINGLLVISQMPVYLDGQRLYFDTPPFITNGRTMVPMRKIFESLGAEVTWDQATRTATAVKGDRSVSVTIDNPGASVNGQAVTLDAAPALVDGRTLVPLRFVSEALGASVDWDPVTRTVRIESGIAGQAKASGLSVKLL